jgi:hypothetical protein
MPGNLPQRRSCRKGNWPVAAIADRCWPCLAYVTGQDRTWGDYALFPGVVAAQPTPAPREPSPRIRASPPTQATFFRHGRSYPSLHGDTQLLRLSAILVSTFYPPGRCCAWSEADAWPILSTPLQCNCGGICSLEEFAVGTPLISWRACPQRSLRTAKPSASFSLGAWRSTPQLPSQRIRAWRSGRAIPSCPSGVRSVSRGRTTT